MLKEVKEAVSDETDGNQLPWYESSITGNFCFKAAEEGCAKFIKVIYDPFLEGIYDLETIDFKNGDRYVGQMKNGLMHGKGIITYVSGIKHKGEFSEGKKNGLGRVFYIGGMTFEGNFKNDRDMVKL